MSASDSKKHEHEHEHENVEVYKAVRGHELELNKATAAFEHAVLSPLYLLNGGAAVAFLTLMGAAAPEESTLRIEPARAMLAIAAWGFGLLFAVLATRSGLLAQRGYQIAERRRRQEIESHIADECVANAAGAVIDDAKISTAPLNQKKYARSVNLSIALFAVGVVCAAFAVLA